MINYKLLCFILFFHSISATPVIELLQNGNCTRIEEEPYIRCEPTENSNEKNADEIINYDPSEPTTPSSSSNEESEITILPPSDDEIKKELSEPPPIRKDGPTIMEELFIDYLTGSTPQTPTPNLRDSLIHIHTRQLFILCRRFLPFARRHCHREFTLIEYIEPCRGYFQDCKNYIPRRNLVHDLSRAYQQNVLYGNHGYPFQSLPEYYKK